MISLLFLMLMVNAAQACYSYEKYPDGLNEGSIAICIKRGLGTMTPDDILCSLNEDIAPFQAESVKYVRLERVLTCKIRSNSPKYSILLKVFDVGSLYMQYKAPDGWNCNLDTAVKWQEGEQKLCDVSVLYGKKVASADLIVSSTELRFRTPDVTKVVAYGLATKEVHYHRALIFDKKNTSLFVRVSLRGHGVRNSVGTYFSGDVENRSCRLDAIYNAHHQQYAFTGQGLRCEEIRPFMGHICNATLKSGLYNADAGRVDSDLAVLLLKSKVFPPARVSENAQIARLFYQVGGRSGLCSLVVRRAGELFYVQFKNVMQRGIIPAFMGFSGCDILKNASWVERIDESGQYIHQMQIEGPVLEVGPPSPNFQREPAFASLKITSFGVSQKSSCEFMFNQTNLSRIFNSLDGELRRGVYTNASGSIALPLSDLLGAHLSLRFWIEGECFCSNLRRQFTDGKYQTFDIFETIFSHNPGWQHHVIHGHGIDLYLLDKCGGGSRFNPVEVRAVSEECVSIVWDWMPNFAAECVVTGGSCKPITFIKKLFWKESEQAALCLFSREEYDGESLCVRSLEAYFNTDPVIANSIPKDFGATLQYGHDTKERKLHFFVEKNDKQCCVRWTFGDAIYYRLLDQPLHTLQFKLETAPYFSLALTMVDHEQKVYKICLCPSADNLVLSFYSENGVQIYPEVGQEVAYPYVRQAVPFQDGGFPQKKGVPVPIEREYNPVCVQQVPNPLPVQPQPFQMYSPAQVLGVPAHLPLGYYGALQVMHAGWDGNWAVQLPLAYYPPGYQGGYEYAGADICNGLYPYQ